MSWPLAADRSVAHVLRTLSRSASSHAPDALCRASLLERAELHGVAGVVHDAWLGAGDALDDATTRKLQARRVARDLDHAAHLAMLARVDGALARAGLRAAALKGPLFAERYYARPETRATSDIDLLVTEATLERAIRALAEVGYEASDDPREAWYRREHHHLHLTNHEALPLELHFHAYRGFGRTMRSEPLLARARAAGRKMEALSVLAPEDELVYLAVHAAAHRFVRLGWLYDLALLIETMDRDAIATARERAHEIGYGRVLAFAGELLREVMGVERASLLGRLGGLRSRLVHRVTAEPDHPTLRSATRFIYTTSLCDSPRAAARYATRAVVDRAALFLGAS